MGLKKKRKRRWLYVIIGVFAILTALHFGINYWVKTTLPKIIEEKNDTPYNFSYKEVGFSIWKNAIWVKGIHIDPKDVSNPKTPVDFIADIEEIGVQGVNFIRLLRNKEISAYAVYIKTPDVTYYKWAEKRERAHHSKSLSETLHVGRFNITNGHFLMYDSDRTTQKGEIEKLNIELRGVDLSEATLSKKIPFKVASFQFKTGAVSFQLNPLQRLKSKSFKIDNNSFVIKGVELKTDGQQPIERLTYALLPEIEAPLITLTGMDFGYEEDGDNYFMARTLEFDNVDVKLRQNLDRHLSKVDDRGHFIPFKLDIDKITFKNSSVESLNSFRIENFDISIDSLRNAEAERLSVKTVAVNHPAITVLHREPRKTTESRSEHLAQFHDNISVGSFSVQKASFHQILADNTSRDLKNVNVEVTGIEITPETYKRKIPVEFLTLSLDTAPFNFPLDKVNKISSDGISFEDGNLSLKNFSISPLKGKEKLAEAMNISASAFNVSQIKWELEDTSAKGFDADFISLISVSYNKDGTYFKSPSIELSRPSWRFSGPSGEGLTAGILKIHSLNARLNPGKTASTHTGKKSAALIPIYLNLDKLSLGNTNLTVINGAVIRNLNLEIDGFKNIPGKSIRAGIVKVNHPEVTLPQKSASAAKKTAPKKNPDFKEEILIGNFMLDNAGIRWTDKLKEKDAIDDIKLSMTGIQFSSHTLKNTIPVEFKTINLSTSPFSMALDDVNRLSSGPIHYQNGNLAVSNVNISPQTGKENAAGALRINAPSVSLSNAHWYFDDPTHPGLRADALILPSLDVKTGKPKTGGGKKSETMLPIALNIGKVNIGKTGISLSDEISLSQGALNLSGLRNSAKEGLSIQNLALNGPEIVLVSKKKSDQKKKESSGPASKIKIGGISISQAGLSVNTPEGKSSFRLPQFSVGLSDFLMDSNTSKQKIPFNYKGLSLNTGSINYSVDEVYDVKLSSINLKSGTLNINGLKYIPKMTREQFVASLKVEKDLYSVTTDNVQMQGTDFGFKGNDFFFKSDHITFNRLDADIFRSKIPPDDKSFKKMYSQLLRDLKFYLDVNTLDIKNSTLVYEEHVVKGSGTGKLTFSDFNANIKNVHSGFKKTKLPDVVIDVNTDFMGPSRLTAHWTFNPMNKNDDFNIYGNMTNFEASHLTPFLEPNLHATTTGNIERVEFNFNGNNINGNGTMGLKYDKLHVTLINPRTGKPKKFISKMGNLLIKSKSHDKLKETDVKTVARNQDKSFFNFLWLLVMQGLKQTVLLI